MRVQQCHNTLALLKIARSLKIGKAKNSIPVTVFNYLKSKFLFKFIINGFKVHILLYTRRTQHGAERHQKNSLGIPFFLVSP